MRPVGTVRIGTSCAHLHDGANACPWCDWVPAPVVAVGVDMTENGGTVAVSVRNADGSTTFEVLGGVKEFSLSSVADTFQRAGEVSREAGDAAREVSLAFAPVSWSMEIANWEANWALLGLLFGMSRGEVRRRKKSQQIALHRQRVAERVPEWKRRRS